MFRSRRRASASTFLDRNPQQQTGRENARAALLPGSSLASPRSVSRRQQRKLRREQFQLVADEIESVLRDEDEVQPSVGFLLNNVSAPPLSPIPSNNQFPGRKRRFSLPTLRRTSQSSCCGDQELAPTSPIAATLQSPLRRRRRRSTTTERDINSYTLFDPPQPRTPTTSPRSIYSKGYYDNPSAFFTLLFVVLASTFCLLIVIRLLISLVVTYYAVGLACGALFLVHLLTLVVTRPTYVLRQWHARPLRSWATVGLLVGGLSSLYQCCDSYGYRRANVADNGDEFPNFLLVVLWGLAEGLVIGIEIGALWWVVFGDAADPSRCSQWVGQVWRRLRRLYLSSVRTRKVTGGGSRSKNVLVVLSQDKRQCMICLEDFPVDDDDATKDRQYLPCGHCFHGACVGQWLRRKASCPICRIAIVPEDSTMVHDGNADGSLHPMLLYYDGDESTVQDVPNIPADDGDSMG